jgi:uncharacterized protein YjbI with pentapeptide repeats
LDLSGLDLSGATFDSGEFEKLILKGAHLPPAANFKGMIITHQLDLTGADVPEAGWAAEVAGSMRSNVQGRGLLTCASDRSSPVCAHLNSVQLIVR